jgi:putative transcriptional regulator
MGCGQSLTPLDREHKGEAFEQLVRSVRQAGRIRRGRARPSRSTAFKPADVKAIRARVAMSQSEFAMIIGVSVATLRNWEQGRRTPEGPALALLRVAASEPKAVARALEGFVPRGAASASGSEAA